jgi:hypothetical protein
MPHFDSRLALILCLVCLVAAAWPVPASAQPRSACADCHFARPDAPGQTHLLDWDRSPHRRNDVGCERCHGGDASTFESFLAHRDILHPSDPASPIHPRNIPRTCGTCHVGPLLAFQDSRHHELLQTGARGGPTCVTCHGEVDGRVLSPKALESRCSSCHGPDERAPRAERARNARETYEGLTVVREQLKLAGDLVRRVDRGPRRDDLLEQLRQAEVPLIRAVNAGHRFEYDALRDALAQAQERVEALLGRLANVR